MTINLVLLQIGERSVKSQSEVPGINMKRLQLHEVKFMVTRFIHMNDQPINIKRPTKKEIAYMPYTKDCRHLSYSHTNIWQSIWQTSLCHKKGMCWNQKGVLCSQKQVHETNKWNQTKPLIPYMLLALEFYRQNRHPKNPVPCANHDTDSSAGEDHGRPIDWDSPHTGMYRLESSMHYIYV